MTDPQTLYCRTWYAQRGGLRAPQPYSKIMVDGSEELADGTRQWYRQANMRINGEEKIIIRSSDVITASYLSEIVIFTCCIPNVSTCVMHLWCMCVYNSNYYNILVVLVLMLD